MTEKEGRKRNKNRGQSRHSLGKQVGEEPTGIDESARARMNAPLFEQPGTSQPGRPKQKAWVKRDQSLPGTSPRAERRHQDQAAIDRLAAMSEEEASAELDRMVENERRAKERKAKGIPEPRLQLGRRDYQWKYSREKDENGEVVAEDATYEEYWDENGLDFRPE